MNFINTNTKYRNIYFDLDNTLWDFEKNSEETLSELFASYFPDRANELQDFLDIYYPINDKMWELYRKGEISKQELRDKRFAYAFQKMNINIDDIKFEREYILKCPQKTNLFPHTIEVLEYLKRKGYHLYLLTNGFKEIQINKIKYSNLDKYFEKMITSEEAGYKKPHRKMFEYALKSVSAKKAESIMIGDDLEADIEGCIQFKMDSIYFNRKNIQHDKSATYEINCLSQIKDIL